MQISEKREIEEAEENIVQKKKKYQYARFSQLLQVQQIFSTILSPSCM